MASLVLKRSHMVALKHRDDRKGKCAIIRPVDITEKVFENAYEGIWFLQVKNAPYISNMETFVNLRHFLLFEYNSSHALRVTKHKSI